MKTIDLNNWNRKRHFDHFNALADPYFGVTVPVDVTKAYQFAKSENVSFFGKYLHDCMKAINAVENFRYRIVEDNVIDFDAIHASATLMRSDKTFGFSFINYSEDLATFLSNLKNEKERIENSNALYPPVNSENCIHCSALPWLNFSGHKEPFSGRKDSVPKLAFSKVENIDNKLVMNVAVSANHALVDGYHVGQFVEIFQENLYK